jgi:diguanylate cyclase (GGDEF)-like protein
MRRSAEILRFDIAGAKSRPEHGREPAPAPHPLSAIRRLAAEVDRLKAELVESRQRLRDLEAVAETDPLCGVLNRRGFERALGQALSHSERYGSGLALIYLDLDRFKPINDRYGHAVGDRVLVAVAKTLVASVRNSDSVARLGGDEFAVIVWNIRQFDLNLKVESLARALSELEVAGLASGAIQASCGFAIARPGDTAASLTARADAAMYRCKAESKAASPLRPR